MTMVSTQKTTCTSSETSGEEDAKESQNQNDDDVSAAESSTAQAVSSSSSDAVDDDESSSSSSGSSDQRISMTTTTEKQALIRTGASRLFAPYRTVGIVSSGAFHLIPHQNSAQGVAACPIGERFQLLRTDRLHPVLVSQAVTVAKKSKSERKILHLIADASLSITVASHGSVNDGVADTVTLFQRTSPVSTKKMTAKCWKIRDMVSMGRIQAPVTNDPEKEGRYENTAVIAIILAKDSQEDDDDSIPVVGEDDNDGDDSSSSDESASSSSDSESSHEEETSSCMAQILVLLASRTTLTVRKRISLRTLPTFLPFTAMHPATYLNKLVLGGTDGGKAAACLVNIRSGKVVHSFRCLPSKGECVTALEQAPAVDTVAMGTKRGTVHLVNLKCDKILFSLKHKGRDQTLTVSITSISFRTDGSAMQYGIAPMAVGRSDGNITIWDLSPPEDEEMGRTVLCEMDRVHPGGVAKLQYFPQEPLLLSTGKTSNSILMHIFDNPDHSARLLRQRKGHTAPPCKIRYLHAGAGAGGGVLANMSDGTDASSCQILSSGGPDRTLRVFSTARTVLDKEFSQGRGLEKRARKLGLENTAELLLPPLIDMALSEARSRDWGDLVTIHQGSSFAYVWSTRLGAQSGPILRQDKWNISAMKKSPPAQTNATSVAMSACGSFALVGTRGGTIYKYNVQSGIPRGSYPGDPTALTAQDRKKSRTIGHVDRTLKTLEKTLKTKTRASNLDKKMIDAQEAAKREKRLTAKLRSASHAGFAVTGLAVDSVNKTLISVGSDAKLILWNFVTHAPHKRSPYTLPCPATKMLHVRDSDLAAIALNDFSVVLFDCAALSIVRRFGKGTAQHKAAINDLCFSPDGRNLYTSSIDGTIRVWDVPTNSCVDWLGFKAPPTSITVSPTGEYLATTHSGKLGISIWTDKSFYQIVHVDEVDFAEPARMDEPVPISDFSGLKRSHITETPIVAHLSRNGIAKDGDDMKVPVVPKEKGLITLSGLPTAHWKNLFHLELVKERNKPKEAPKKPPSAPFFLQWRGGESLSEPAAEEQKTEGGSQNEEGEWAASWSDDGNNESESAESNSASVVESKRERVPDDKAFHNKRRKVKHYRSHLAALLKECSLRQASSDKLRYQAVTEFIATLGPSAIDVAISSLCNGMHDLDEGLPLLLLGCHWLSEACQERERFEAVNAYLHRFLSLHAFVVTGIREDFTSRNDDLEKTRTIEEKEERMRENHNRIELIEAVEKLKVAQKAGTEALRGKMEHTLCLLQHFSRMV